MTTRVLVLIITNGRWHHLKLCLESLAKSFAALQDETVQFRGVLGLNGVSAPEWLASMEVVERDLMHIQKIDVHLSPPSARNEILRLYPSQTDLNYILFLDDDVIVPELFLSHLAKHIRENPAVYVLGGPNLSPPQAHLFEHVSGLALASVMGTSLIHRRYSSQRTTFVTNSELPFTLCNLCVKHNGHDFFSQQLHFGEETDLLQRLFHGEDHQGLYSSELFVWHFRRSTPQSFLRQMFKYGIGRGITLQNASPQRRLQFSLLMLLYALGFLWILSSPVLAGIVLVFFLATLSAFEMVRGKEYRIKVFPYLMICFLYIYVFYPLGVLAGMLQKVWSFAYLRR